MGDHITMKYQTLKWSTFGSMYAGYLLVVLNRKSFSFVLPAVIKEGKLDKGDLGLIASSQNVAYTFSKFFGGLAADHISSKLLFSVSVIMTGIFTTIFAATGFDSVAIFTLMWFLQGTVQGGAWPACAKVLKQWCGSTEFGSMWSILSTSMNVAGSLGPLFAAFLLSKLEWRPILVLFGTLAIGMGSVCFLTIVNSPAACGFEGAEVIQNDSRQRSGRGRGNWQDMLTSPFMWVLCASYMVVYVGRTAALDWAQLLLIQELGQTEYIGSFFVSSVESGGIIGSILAGYAADKLVAMSQRDDVKGTPRMTVATIYVFVNIISLHCLIFTISEISSKVWISFVGACMGFGIYGPVALYGVMAIEAAPTHLSGTAHALVALSANIGAVVAGLPFSYLAKYLNWKGAFITLEVLLVCILFLKIVTRNIEYKMVPILKKLH